MDNYTEHITKTSQETEQLGEQMAARQITAWEKNEHIPHVYCLYGDLGSGKTTFTKGFARELGVTSRLLSPTFLLAKRYGTGYDNRYLYHLDIYRTSMQSELIGIGLNEMIEDRKSCVIIEWAEKLEALLPKSRIDIRFQANEDGSHTIKTHIYE